MDLIDKFTCANNNGTTTATTANAATLINHSYNVVHSKFKVSDICFYDFSLKPTTSKNSKLTIDQLLDYKGIMRENYLIARGNYTKAKIVSGRFKKTGQPLAIKMINLRNAPENMLKHAREECEAVKALDHSGLCKTYHFFCYDQTIFIIMNYPGSITLSEEVSRYTCLPLETVIIYTCELTCALGYLHSRQIAHRDIKPDNIILRRTCNSELSTIVLVDFGFSVKLRDPTQSCNVFCGTRAYKAPEIRSAIPYNPFYSDIWSLGVVICKMLTSKTIFSGLTNNEVIAIITDDVTKYILKNSQRVIPPDILATLSCILKHYPHKRLKLHDILLSKWILRNSKCREILNRLENTNFFIANPSV